MIARLLARVMEIITKMITRSRPAPLAPVRATFVRERPVDAPKKKPRRRTRYRTVEQFKASCAMATLHQPRLTVEEACEVAGIPMPTTAREVADTYLVLLTLGIEHEGTGRTDWLDAMLVGAPKEP